MQHFVTISCRLAIDLTTCLTCDIKKAVNEEKIATMLTLDIKSAYDAILPGRLVRRMREQGWQENLVKWTSSFTSNR